jgi:phage/plasmid-associated DNA primase
LDWQRSSFTNAGRSTSRLDLSRLPPGGSDAEDDWADAQVGELETSDEEQDFKHLFRNDNGPLAAPADFSDTRALALLDYVFEQCDELRAVPPGNHARLADMAAQLFAHHTHASVDLSNAKMQSGLVLLIDRLMGSGLMVPNTADGNERHGKGIVIQEVFRLCHSILSLSAMHLQVSTLTTDNPDGHMVSLAIAGVQNLADWQSLLMRACKFFAANGYRRFNGNVYQRISVAKIKDLDDMPRFVRSSTLETLEGAFEVLCPAYDTHAWEVVGTVLEVLHTFSNKDANFEFWKDMTKAGGHTIKSLSEYMEKMQDHDFPELKPHPKYRAFTNGILCNVDRLEFFEYGGPRTVPSSIMCCRFYDMPFPEHVLDFKHWQNIPTPAMDEILSYQQSDPAVLDTIWAFFGRLGYQIEERDKWQVLFMIIGVAGSGKSTLAKMASYLYDTSQVAIMPSNIEVKFGLDPLADGFVCICMEVTKDTDVQRGDLQCMISGEEMQLARKNGKPRKHKWKSHLLFLGNSPGPWVDVNGNMTRRMVMVSFDLPVRHTRPNLDDELQQEIPFFVAKCLLAYQECSHRNSKRSVWAWMPKYFSQISERVQAQTNPIRAFFKDNSLVVECEGKRLLMTTAYSLYKKFEKQNSRFATERMSMEAFSMAVQTDLFFKIKSCDREPDPHKPDTFLVAGMYIMDLMSVNDDVDQPVKAQTIIVDGPSATQQPAPKRPLLEFPNYGLEQFCELFEQRAASLRIVRAAGTHAPVRTSEPIVLRRRRSVMASSQPSGSSPRASYSARPSSKSSSSSSSSSKSSSSSSSSSSSYSSSSSSPGLRFASSSSSLSSSSKASPGSSPSSRGSDKPVHLSQSKTYKIPEPMPGSQLRLQKEPSRTHKLPLPFDPSSKYKEVQI